jgi:hypothetical protein
LIKITHFYMEVLFMQHILRYKNLAIAILAITKEEQEQQYIFCIIRY